MGFKFSALTLPGDWDAAQLMRLRVVGSRRLADATFIDATLSSDPCVIRWHGHTHVFSWNFRDTLAEQVNLGLEGRVLDALRGRPARYLATHSFDNFYALVAWREGQRVRRLVGSTTGPIADEGTALAEESMERARFRELVLDGVQHFEDKESGERYSQDQVAGLCVLAASATVFGAPLHLAHRSLQPLEDGAFPQYESFAAHEARLFGE